MRRLKGFTLLEVLIASGLLALMGTLLFSTMNSAIDVRERVEPASDHLHLVRQAMDRMGREISMAYLSAHRSPDESKNKTQFLGDKKELSFVAFGHGVAIAEVKQSDQVKIRYYLGTDKETKTESLLREIEINPGLMSIPKKNTQTLCPNIKKLEFEYWNDSLSAWDSEWKTEGAQSRDSLPPRVRIKLVSVGPDKKEQEFMTQTFIFLTKTIQMK